MVTKLLDMCSAIAAIGNMNSEGTQGSRNKSLTLRNKPGVNFCNSGLSFTKASHDDLVLWEMTWDTEKHYEHFENVCLYCSFTAQSIQWGHVECKQFI